MTEDELVLVVLIKRNGVDGSDYLLAIVAISSRNVRILVNVSDMRVAASMGTAEGEIRWKWMGRDSMAVGKS